MSSIKRYLKLNLDYRKIGGVHFVWLGPVCFSFCKRRRPAQPGIRHKSEVSAYAGYDSRP